MNSFHRVKKEARRMVKLDQPRKTNGPSRNTYLTTPAEHHQQWINEALKQNSHQRESKWAESIAIGSKTFVEETKKQLQSRKGRKIEGQEEVYELRERTSPYDFDGKNSTLRSENTYFWNDNDGISNS